ncbi:hypothetical protein JOD54_001321 [Actinokineospora baliensis]|uniref:hypothetical protein n=1 Tax=Actinokineospora baliensis TaxID=547056 RepID=UPI001958FF25|nr:hypothetical protein [Actinokineospora baliensis]MBM7771117.1 hypothetical protein [Actinokineospora baliensis]
MDIDDELRRLFADDRLDLPVSATATDAVVAGAGRRRRRRVAVTAASGVLTAAVVLAGGVALGGLNTSSAPPGGQVMPTLTTTVTQSSATTAPTTLSEAVAQMTGSSMTGAVSTVPELRPTGFSKIRLGMSVAEAEATGELVPLAVKSADCKAYRFKSFTSENSMSVGISPTDGVVAIFPPAQSRTPEGVWLGTSKADVHRLYPVGTTDANGSWVVDLGGGRAYLFGFGPGDTVHELALYSEKQKCFG